MESRKIGFVTMIANALRRYNSLSSDVRLFIGCQFALESDYGTSHLCARNSNYCGMRIPRVRISLAVNSNTLVPAGDFACYSSLSDCVADYVLWLQYNHCPIRAQKNVDDFSKFLVEKGYCPDKDYIQRILSIYNQFI